jgi:hypothetical protein
MRSIFSCFWVTLQLRMNKTRAYPVIALSVCLTAGLSCAAGGGAALLNAKQAETLVMNTPEALRSKGLHRCPMAELLTVSDTIMSFQIRSSCRTSGSGLLGNFSVDLSSGELWYDVDRITPVISKRLRKLRERMFAPAQR